MTTGSERRRNEPGASGRGGRRARATRHEIAADVGSTNFRSDRARGEERLNVLYLGTLPPHPGGSAMVGAALLAALSDAGHRVRALSPGTAETLGTRDPFAARHPSIEVRRYEVPYSEVDVRADRPETIAFREWEGRQIKNRLGPWIEEERPDVVVLARDSFVWHATAAWSAHIPCVLLAQGAPVPYSIARGEYGDELVHAVLDGYRKMDRVVAVAESLGNVLRRLGVERVSVVVNGVDTSRFFPRGRPPELAEALEIGCEDRVILHVSNLKAVKRPFDLVASAEIALRRDPRLIFVVAGDGPLGGALREACRERRLDERFRFAGWVDPERIADYYALADAVVMPSEVEARSLACLEAQASGRVLVASDIPAMREIVRDGGTGLLFPMGDREALASQTLRAVSDRELSRRIGVAARSWAETQELSQSLRRHESILLEVVRGRVSP